MRRLGFRAGAVLLGFAAALLLMEAGVRVAGIHPPRTITKRILTNEATRSVAYHCYPSNPHGEFSPAPEVDAKSWRLRTFTFEPEELPIERLAETPWCVKYEFSSEAIRDREYLAEPPPEVQRIAVIGDSFVFGEGVPLDKTLPRRMEALLGEGYEVINGGVVGADTRQELEVLANIVEGANCTRAVFVFIPNDIGLTPQLARRQEYLNDLIVVRDEYVDDYESKAWYTGHSRLAHLIGGHFAMNRIRRETIQWYLDSYDPRHNGPNLAALEQDIRSLSEVPNCRVAFVLYPLMEGFESGYPLAAIHKRVAGMARRAGLPVLDLTPHFQGRNTESLWVHPSDHHPNGRAHEIASRAITEWLKNDVPGFLDRPQH